MDRIEKLYSRVLSETDNLQQRTIALVDGMISEFETRNFVSFRFQESLATN